MFNRSINVVLKAKVQNSFAGMFMYIIHVLENLLTCEIIVIN